MRDMRGIKKLAYFTISFAIYFSFFSLNSGAEDFLTSAEHIFFDRSQYQRRFGVEIEFTGLQDGIIEQVIESIFSAEVVERLDHGEVKFHSPYGEIKLKIESSAWRFALSDPKRYQRQWARDLESAAREIVLPPLTYENIELFDKLSTALVDLGAIGANAENGVSTQVNVEMPPLAPSLGGNPQALKNLINLLRIYSRPEHIEQMKDKLNIPEIRKQYLYEMQPGFLKKLHDPDYNPTLREFYDDYLYRQSLEFLGFRNAWTLPTEDAKQLLLDQQEIIVPQVVKMVRLRVSSLLLQAFPEDPLSRAITLMKWARPLPIVEMKEFNNDFDFGRTIRRALGIVHSAELFGNYSHDTLVESITGIDHRDLEKIRALHSKKPIIRYALYDPKENYLGEENQGWNEGVVWIQVHPQLTGHRPLYIDGESVVYHRRHIHKATILGKYNPGLENALIQQVMENKIFEMKLFQYFAPGAMPEGVSLTELMGNGPTTETIDIKKLGQLLGDRFKDGWVMKGAWDLSTEKAILTERDWDTERILNADLRNFEAHRSKTETEMSGADPEAIINAVKKHKDYKTWKIRQLLAQPNHLFFQKRLAIKREFRVEVQGAKVLGQGSTIDRYGYQTNPRQAKPTKPQKKINEAEVKAAEKFVQSIIDKLPDALRFLPYGFDIALLEDGSLQVIESNPGGNCSFLEENDDSVDALDHYLSHYPNLIKEGQIKLLSPRGQMLWIRKTFKELGMDPARDYPGMHFEEDNLIDPEYVPIADPTGVCEKLLR